MEPTSPQKSAASLGNRLSQKIEEDASAVVSVTQKKLDALAETSTKRLSDSLNTTITDIESHLKKLRKLSLSMWIVSLMTGAVLTLGMLIGLGLYAQWKLHQVRALDVREQAIKAEMKNLPPQFQVIQSGGQWYLLAARIGPHPRQGAVLRGKPAEGIEIYR